MTIGSWKDVLPGMSPPIRLGVALASERIWAVPLTRWAASPTAPRKRGHDADAASSEPHESSRAGRWSRAVEAHQGGNASWIGLREALAELRAEFGKGPGILHVALLPPLVQARRIELPRLRADELRRVLTRDASRYFLGADEPQVVSAQIAFARRRSPVPVFACAAPVQVVELVLEAAGNAGWRVDSLAPSYAAWGAAARVLWPGLQSGTGCVVLFGEADVEVIRLNQGQAMIVRRSPLNAEAEEIANTIAALRDEDSRPPRAMPARVDMSIGDSVPEVGRRVRSADSGASDAGEAFVPRSDPGAPVILVGPEGLRGAVTGILAERGVPVSGATGPTDPFGVPEELAAAYAARATGPELLPERFHTERRRRRSRLTGALGAAACLVLIAAGALELWGTHRELDGVRAEREALAEDVRRALARRDELARLEARVSALARLEADRPRWSEMIVGIARALPQDAFLAMIQAEADSVAIEGVAVEAARVLAAVGDAPGIAAVRVSAPVRREARMDGTSAELFSIALRLAAAEGKGDR